MTTTPRAPLRTEIRVRIAGQTLPARTLTGTETLNQPTRLTLELHDLPSNALPVTLGEALDTPVRVEITGPGLDRPRRFHLNLDSADERWCGGAYQLDLHLASKLERGKRLGQARLFMDRSRESVLRQLLAEMGYDRIEIDLALDPVPAFDGPFLQVERETTLDCFHRLLADVGANYWFEAHDPDQTHERLVIRNDALISPYVPHIEWGRSVSGLAPDRQLNRITAAYQAWTRQPRSAAHSVLGRTPGALSREQADHRRFAPPRPRPEAEQRARFEQEYLDQQRYRVTLHGHQPLLSAGYSVSFDSGQLPNDCPSGDYRLIQVRHHAETGGGEGASPGVQYRNTAVVIPRATPPRPRLTAPPKLPHLFPARIESRHDHAQLNADGHYYFRADFDRGDRDTGRASPATGRLTPYASAKTDKAPIADAIGWHFPLLDRSRVLVGFLNNDPARPVILGFVPGDRQVGPVRRRNRRQSRIKTPGHNELTVDDARGQLRIALHTLDQQLCLELNAGAAQPYVHLHAIHGGVNLYAGLNLRLEAEADLAERIGADRSQTVKQNSATTTGKGAIHHQAHTDQRHLAQINLTQSAGKDFSLWVRKKSLSVRARDGLSTTVKAGDYAVQVKQGAVIHQVAGDITIQGDGGGDIVLTRGDAGLKLDPSGNIKLFGKSITLDGQSGVTFNGDVQYEDGAGNEPEEAPALSLDELPEAATLAVDGEAAITSVAWSGDRVKHEQTIDFVVAHRALTEGSDFQVTVERINPDGSTETIDTPAFPVEEANGVTYLNWRAPEDVATGERLDGEMPANPYYVRFRVDCDDAASDWSEPARIDVDLRLDITTEAGIAMKDGTPVDVTTADGREHRTHVANGIARLTDVASGPATVRIPEQEFTA